MSVYELMDNKLKDHLSGSSLNSDWRLKSPISTPRSSSPLNRNAGEDIFHRYPDLIHSKSNISTEAKPTEPVDRPFDFLDDDEFAFGINLLNHNVACVGDNITKLIQMAQEPWPDNVKLFQPYEVEQILLPDNASCLAVQSFLKMCNLPFEVEMRWNAEFMSPSGRVPFIKCGAFVVSELEPIVQFAANKGVTLSGKLSTEEKAEMRAYMSLITNVLVNAELYISWLDNETFNAVTKVRNSSVYPWPLGWIQTRSKRNAVAKRLKALHWHEKTLDQVLADVEQCCNSLSQRLGERDYFFGTPTPLDGLLYAHTRALLSSTGPRAPLMIKPITNIMLRHMMRIASLTKMALVPQEEYLVTQAFKICQRRLSPDRTVSERSTRMKRSKLCMRNPSRDSLVYGRDVFGFKPFASKQIIIMTSNEGNITCEYNSARKGNNYQHNDCVYEILEDILEKVFDVAVFTYKKDKNDDFEVIVIANHVDDVNNDIDDSKNGNYSPNDVGNDDYFEIKSNDYLQTIQEVDNTDNTDTTASLDANADDVVQIVDNDDLEDTDGVINEKLLSSEDMLTSTINVSTENRTSDADTRV